jgi:ABC-type lipoprotein release transport system permease subunit
MSATIHRFRAILDFTLSSLLRRRARNLSLLTIYTLVVFVIASLIFFVQALKRDARNLLQQAPDMVVQRMVAGRHDLMPLDRVQAIASIRGVRAVVPRLWGYYYDPLFGGNFSLVATDALDLPPDSIRIGQGVARNLRVNAGDLITLRSYTNLPTLFTVQQILPADSELVSSDLILLSSSAFREFYHLPQDQATDLAVLVGNPRELPTIAAKIADQFPDSRPILKSEMLRTYDAIFEWRGGLMVVVLAMAVLAFVIFAWDKASGLSAEERKEIGILKSIGWETADVLQLKFWEGGLISLLAFCSGVLLAYGHVYFFSATLFEHALKGWSVLYPKYRLTPTLDAYQLGVLLFLTVVPYTVATIIPCWRAATVDPDAAMRS